MVNLDEIPLPRLNTWEGREVDTPPLEPPPAYTPGMDGDDAFLLASYYGGGEGGGGDPADYPVDNGEYTYIVTGGVGAWTLRKLPPDMPDAIPGEDCYYVLRRNSSGTPAWFKMFFAEIPDCSTGTLQSFTLFAKSDPGP